ncbi:5-guanidino-2-oxopentanoate decarboxylase [Aliiroseovarius sp. YM-037]|uniref:5-guanidino-2-oxopentanoate decarboxylase n=1 Tax=Aliiroseovarius sp. YM-037 TaxID=3341728 RepID=UPI003A802F2A
MTKRPLGAQISHMLKDRGVDTIFGIPGVHNVEMYRGIEEAGITHVLARHEQGAGFMADGYARAAGRPGVAYVITGPGVCNIMTPMGQAYSDSVPMLVISSCLDETAATRGQLHQMKDQRAAAETVCDWSEEARTAKAAYQLIDRALLEFDVARPRPKHIQVPIELLGTDAPDFPSGGEGDGRLHHADAIEGIVLPYLRQAKRPLVIFGAGAKTENARMMVEKIGAACFSTYAARGIVGDDYPLDFGATLSYASSADVVASADLVIAIGTELAAVDIQRNHLGHSCPMIRVDIDPECLFDQQRAEVRVHADAADFVDLVIELSDDGAATDWTSDEVAAARAKWRAEADAAYPGIIPICDALRDALPDDTMIYSDMTQIAYVAKEIWPMKYPGHWHHPYGFGTLGYALPAAIGGKIGVGDKPVAAIMGDYGFHYTMQELGVAVELGLNIPIVLWDNAKLKEIEDCMVQSQIAPNAVFARNPDFCKLAEAFGAKAAAPGSLAELQDAVQAAFAADGPTLIHVTPDILG